MPLGLVGMPCEDRWVSLRRFETAIQILKTPGQTFKDPGHAKTYRDASMVIPKGNLFETLVCEQANWHDRTPGDPLGVMRTTYFSGKYWEVSAG